MKSHRRPADHHVPGAHFGDVQQVFFFRHPDRKSRQFNHPVGNDARHLRRLATRQNAPTRRTPLGHARDEPRDLRFLDPPDANVVEKKDRIAAGRQHIIHVHRHQILARRLQHVVLQQHLELGPHPIRPGHDHRVLVRPQIIGRRKQAERIRQLPVLLRRRHQTGNIPHQRRRPMRVHARPLVGELRFLLSRGRFPGGRRARFCHASPIPDRSRTVKARPLCKTGAAAVLLQENQDAVGGFGGAGGVRRCTEVPAIVTRTTTSSAPP